MIFLDNIDDVADEGADSGNDDIDCRGREMTMSSVWVKEWSLGLARGH